MKFSSFLLASPLALFAFPSAITSSVSAAVSPEAVSAGPLPYGGVARTAAIKSANGEKAKKFTSTKNVAFVPRSYIVELDASQAKSGAGSKRSEPLAAVHEHLAKRGKKGSYKTRYEWNHPETFVGMSVVLNSDEDYELLQNAPGVKAVYRNNLYSLPAFDAVVASNSYVREAVGTSSSSKHDRLIERARPTGAEVGIKDTFAPHVMTGVDKLHAEGYFGKGQTIGVIDSGIDYTHSALGGKPNSQPCFGPGCKVIGGYDFVGDAYTGSNTPVADSDPFADCPGSGHGTHVAGTIAANDTDLGFTGVAPHANLRAYRVFGCKGSASDDVIIAALQRAFFDRNDIVSLSIGGPGGWPESPSAAVAGRIVGLGTPVIIANGNDGAYGTYYASVLSTGPGIAAVGSVNNIQLTGYPAKVVPSGLGIDSIVYLVGTPFKFNGSAVREVYATNTNPEVANDACSPLPDSTPDLSNKVVIVGRGTCPFTTKFQNIAAKGGNTVLVYNTPAPVSITYVISDIPGQQAAALTCEAGQFLVKQAAAGKISLDFSELASVTIPDANSGGIMSSFSMYTPDYENNILPQISAPGGNILSTWPVKLGKYSIISGTSMAVPFVSGSYAIYRAAHGGKTDAEALRSIFGSTGTPLKQTKDKTTLLETVIKQGSGLTNVYNAVYQEVTYSPRSLQLNDTDNFAGEHIITVRNSAKKTRTFTLKHEPAGTAQSIEDNSTVFFNASPVPLSAKYAKVSLSKKSITLAPGKFAKFTVKITPPTGVKAEKLPLYSGYIHLIPNSSKYSGLRIPYAGVAGSMKKAKVLDNTDELFGFQLPALLDVESNPIKDDTHTFSLKDNVTQPGFMYRFAFGTPFYQIDLVPANTTFKPTITIKDGSSPQRRSLEVEGINGMVKRKAAHQHVFQRAVSGDAKLTASKKGHTSTALKFADTKTIGTVYKEAWIGRNSQTGNADDYSYITTFLTRKLFLVQGGTTTVPDGEYKLLIRAQKVFSKGILESDYESYLSHKFIVKA